MTGGILRLRHMGLAPDAPEGILRAADLDAMGSADALVRAAEAQAAGILAGAEAALAEERARGHAEGMEAARAEAAGLMLATLGRLDQRLGGMEAELGRLVHDCVRRIIDRFSDEDLAHDLARAALATMRDQRRGQLFVDPAVQGRIRADLGALLEEFPEIDLIDVIADPTLSAPDLRLESDLGVVSFSLEDTLEDLRNLLVSAHARFA